MPGTWNCTSLPHLLWLNLHAHSKFRMLRQRQNIMVHQEHWYAWLQILSIWQDLRRKKDISVDWQFWDTISIFVDWLRFINVTKPSHRGGQTPSINCIYEKSFSNLAARLFKLLARRFLTRFSHLTVGRKYLPTQQTGTDSFMYWRVGRPWLCKLDLPEICIQRKIESDCKIKF